MYWPVGAARVYASHRSSYDENGASQSDSNRVNPPILALQVCRNGKLFGTISMQTLTLWQVSPVVILSTVTRSPKSIASHGTNVDVLFRPDSSVVVVQTSLGYLITYNIHTDPSTRVYQQQRSDSGSQRRYGATESNFIDQELHGLAEVTLHFRMVIKIDAGIAACLIFDEEIVVATTSPAAVQCIRWSADAGTTQTTTELISKMPWLAPKSEIVDMTHDRAMNLSIWITATGHAYAVQRISRPTTSFPSSPRRDSSSIITSPSLNEKNTPNSMPPHRRSTSNTTPTVPNYRRDSPATTPTATAHQRTFSSATPPAHRRTPSGGTPSNATSPRVRSSTVATEQPRSLFRGYGFHNPELAQAKAKTVAVNARFSLVAVACNNAEILVYTAKDYVGSIPLSQKLQAPASVTTTGNVTTMVYSPDGYCLISAYETGWALWSVYGKLLASSFFADQSMARLNDERWLLGITHACWLGSGSNVLVSRKDDDRLWVIEMAKTAVTGCFCASNISRTTLLTDTTAMIYTAYDLPLTTTPSADPSLWHHVQIPPSYLSRQRPIRSAVTSANGKYLAVAGQRGLAHYSLTSGRWRTFTESTDEDSFVVRGGMCWFQHILIVAAETDDSHEVRLYSRDRDLDDASLLFVEQLPAAIVTMSLTGHDSLLVYTYRNLLYHFVINASRSSVSLVQVGQIALNGIVRAPARVRYVSWILPEEQQRNGDPSNDVSSATVLFLVDAKLVLLQPARTEDGAIKYDMRVIANNVEYFELSRDQAPEDSSPAVDRSFVRSPQPGRSTGRLAEDLNDSLWYFDGAAMHCWLNVEDLVAAASSENKRDLPATVPITTDFYPTSIAQCRGMFLGIDADLIQRRDAQFAFHKFTIRTQLFLPSILQRHLAADDASSASSLAYRYQDLPYFSHALEMLLHTVLDDEVDNPPCTPLLPATVAFLSSFPDFLEIIVQCTRKTEVRFWKTLFAQLPPPHELFADSMRRGLLKTAGGFLLVLQTLEEQEPTSEHCIELLRRAREAGDWELCRELVRFLVALDTSGLVLREAMRKLEVGAVDSEANAGLGVPQSVGLGIDDVHG